MKRLILASLGFVAISCGKNAKTKGDSNAASSVDAKQQVVATLPGVCSYDTNAPQAGWVNCTQDQIAKIYDAMKAKDAASVSVEAKPATTASQDKDHKVVFEWQVTLPGTTNTCKKVNAPASATYMIDKNSYDDLLATPASLCTVIGPSYLKCKINDNFKPSQYACPDQYGNMMGVDFDFYTDPDLSAFGAKIASSGPSN